MLHSACRCLGLAAPLSRRPSLRLAMSTASNSVAAPRAALCVIGNEVLTGKVRGPIRRSVGQHERGHGLVRWFFTVLTYG